MGLIYYLSSQNNIKLPKVGIGFDKVLHLLAYIPLAFLFYISIHTSGFRKHAFIAALCFASMYGITDEIHQSFVPGRDAAIGDVIADCIGAIIGGITAHFAKLRINLI